MSTNFPTSIDTFVNPVPTSDTVIVPHSTQHTNINDSVLALETKVGANSSAVTTTHDYKLGEVTGADKAAGKTATQTLTNKTLSSPKVTVGSDAIGDMYYNSVGAVGTQIRLPAGSNGQVLTIAGGVPSYASPSSANANYIVDTGVSNAYVATLSPALASYTAGVLVQFKAANANTTASTVNVNGLGAKTIKKLGGATDLASGDIAAGMVVQLEYDGTNFIMLNPVANAPKTAVTDIQIFSTGATTSWTKPTGAQFVEVTVIGAGGGGGTGVGTAAGGGGGGYGFKKFSASALGSTETVVVGTGGTSSASGGFSAFGTTVLLRADGGQGVSQNGATTGGSANGDINYVGGSGGSGNNSTSPVSVANSPSPRGGGAGGYNSGTPATAIAGQNGGGFVTYYVKNGGTGGTAGVNNAGATSATVTGLLYGGVGGGGGGYNGNGTNTGGNGGNGNIGSGGGGATATGTAGTGGDGLVAVVSYF